MLLAFDVNGPAHRRILHDAERVHESAMSALQSNCEFGTELDAPEADFFIAEGNTMFREQIFNVSMAQVEAIVEAESLPHELLCVRHN